MGFIVKSAFWLGIVLSAMPLGQLLLSDPTSGVGAFVCRPAGAAWAERFASKEVSYEFGAAGCVALAARAGRRRIDARRSRNLGREDPAFRQIIRPIAHGRGQTASMDRVSASFADSRLAGDASIGL